MESSVFFDVALSWALFRYTLKRQIFQSNDFKEVIKLEGVDIRHV